MREKLLGRRDRRKKQLRLFTNRPIVSRMTLMHLFLLAAIQGVTEFLPVSSSGHLALVSMVSPLPDQGVLIDVALHGGTLLAVMAYFRHDVRIMVQGLIDLVLGRPSKAAETSQFMIMATLPVLIAGALLLVTNTHAVLRQPEIIGWASIAFAIPLYFVDRIAPQRDLTSLTHRDAMWLGLAQMLSLIPGASRSGVTMTAGRALGFSRSDAAHYSMLMAIPVIAVFTILGLVDLARAPDPTALEDGLIAAAGAAVFAFATIHGFMKLTARLSFTPFVIYRLVLGGAILWLL